MPYQAATATRMKSVTRELGQRISAFPGYVENVQHLATSLSSALNSYTRHKKNLHLMHSRSRYREAVQ